MKKKTTKIKKTKAKKTKSAASLSDLVSLLQRLRAPNGCPWDREQTPQSLLPQLIEETYELVEAVQAKRQASIQDELADLLLHVLFQAQLAAEQKQFDIADVMQHLHDKLVRRHPHIFGDLVGTVTDSAAVSKIWSAVKRQEGKKSLLGGIPKAMPALQRAWRLNAKASSIGFDWQNHQQVLDKISEERGELEAAIATGQSRAILEEYGDMLFAMVNLSRFLNVDPELALHSTNDKFVRRFDYMEKRAQEMGTSVEKLSTDELEAIYQEARRSHT